MSALPAPPSPDGKEVIVPESRAAWRAWLADHPERSGGVWVVFAKQTSGLEGPSYGELVEEALCFGWIDSLTKRVDDQRTIQWFSPRRPAGIWARSNKERVERLIAQGSMTPRGEAVIDAAKADGSWTQYDDVDAMVVHADLQAALDSAPPAREAYEQLAPSRRKEYLWWVYSAKRPATRTKRITEMVRRLTES